MRALHSYGFRRALDAGFRRAVGDLSDVEDAPLASTLYALADTISWEVCDSSRNCRKVEA